MKTFVITAACLLLMTGCSTTSPATHEYTILPLYTADPLPRPAQRSLKLSAAKALPSLASKEFYYLKDTAVGTYLHSRWSDTPATMIERTLVSSLENRRLFVTLLPNGSSAAADLILESHLHAFYHRFYPDKRNEGFIDITYRLIDSKTKQTLASKRFILTEPSLFPNAQGGVSALNAATQRLSRETTAWLENLSKEYQWIK